MFGECIINNDNREKQLIDVLVGSGVLGAFIDSIT